MGHGGLWTLISMTNLDWATATVRKGARKRLKEHKCRTTEIINPDHPCGEFRAAVFDFDCTLSLLRRNETGLVAARHASAARLILMGAHVIRAGVARQLIDLMERGLIDHVGTNRLYEATCPALRIFRADWVEGREKPAQEPLTASHFAGLPQDLPPSAC